MAEGINIRVIGDRELERKLQKLAPKVQKKMIRRTFRAHAKVLRARIVSNLSGDPVAPKTGRLRDAMKSAPIRAASRSRRLIRIGVVWPTRGELGIDSDDTHFYPAALEYGHGTVAPHPFMRPAIDNYRRIDVHRIARSLRRQLRAEGLR